MSEADTLNTHANTAGQDDTDTDRTGAPDETVRGTLMSAFAHVCRAHPRRVLGAIAAACAVASVTSGAAAVTNGFSGRPISAVAFTLFALGTGAGAVGAGGLLVLNAAREKARARVKARVRRALHPQKYRNRGLDPEGPDGPS